MYVIYCHVTHCHLSCHYLSSSLRSLNFLLVGKHSEARVRSSCGVQATPKASLCCLLQPMDCVSCLYNILVSTFWCLWVLGSTFLYFGYFLVFLKTFWYYGSVVFKLRLLSPAGDGLRSLSLKPSINLTVGNASRPTVGTVA